MWRQRQENKMHRARIEDKGLCPLEKITQRGNFVKFCRKGRKHEGGDGKEDKQTTFQEQRCMNEI